MKKMSIAILLVLSSLLVGCNEFFSELEIAFFNMNRIAYTEMVIEMDGIPNNDNLDFTIKTDGLHQITTIGTQTRYTYFDENKDIYELIDIEGEYFSYRLEKLGDYELDISVIMELFLLSPQDFRLDDDGYYRPIIVLYDFSELEFIVVDGYITEMNFILNLNDDHIDTTIQFKDINEIELNFPEFTQFTKLQEAEYFLQEDNHRIALSETGFEMNVEDVFLVYNSQNNYIEITKDETLFYYFPDEDYFKINLESNEILEEIDIVDYYQSSFITILNFEYIDKYYHSFVDDIEPEEQIVE